MLVSLRDHSIYVGITPNYIERLRLHNKKMGGKYTRTRTPWMMVYLEPAGDRSSATKLEHRLKRFTHAQKVRKVNSLGNLLYSRQMILIFEDEGRARGPQKAV